jgi:zinc and cadmium transporter
MSEHPTFSIWLYALASVLLVSLTSLAGLAVLKVDKEKLQKAVSSMVALAAGSLFGDAFLELLPESYAQPGRNSGGSVLLGLLFFFVLERFLRWQHAHKLGRPEEIKPVGYVNIVAAAIHNFTDGLIIGVAYLVSVPIGVSTTLAVVFHEIPDELGNFFVLLYAGFSKPRALLFNVLSGAVAILGTLLALLIGSQVQSFSSAILPFAAGGFIYIAGSDLVPELHKEPGVRNSLAQLAAMAVGVGIILLLKLLP